MGEDQAVADHRDGERAQDAAEDGAAAAHERGAAQHHGRDHVELEADGGVGGAAAEARGDHDAGERRGEAAQDVGRERDAAHGDAGPAGGLGVGADGGDVAAVAGLGECQAARDRYE